MADHTHIEWTDATWNPVTGCSVLSPGCTNCYAMKLAGTRLKHHPSRAGLTRDTKAGPVWTGAVRFNEDWLDQPLRWRRPRRIFVCAHGDLFHEDVPDAWIDQVFAVMALAPQHSFQVLTKRPARMRAYVTDRARMDWPNDEVEQLADRPGVVGNCVCGGGGDDGDIPWPLPNVWLGVSAEDQVRLDERIHDLANTPAAIRFLSCEPLLGPLNLFEALSLPPIMSPPLVDWVIAGGESGPGARPMHPDWARGLRDQCAAAGVPFHFKQWGAWWPLDHAAREWRVSIDEARDLFLSKTTETHALIGKAKAGRLLDHVEHNGMPAVAHG